MLNIEQRRADVVAQLEAQLDLSESVIRQLLRAKPRPVNDAPYVPRAVRAGDDPRLMPELPKWAQSVVCPRCHGVMKVIKAKEDKTWGESIMYQCHNPFEGTLCLLTTEVSTSNIFKMTPMDFAVGDIAWKKVAPETQIIVGSAEHVEVYPYKTAPPSPWSRKTLLSVAYDVFWKAYLKDKAGISEKELWEEVTNILPQWKGSPKVDNARGNFPKVVEEATGFVLSIVKGKLTVVGRGEGNLEQEPFSSAKYRTDFGF